MLSFHYSGLCWQQVETVGKTPETAVLLLRSPEEDILIKACEATHAFAEKGTAVTLYIPTCQGLSPTEKQLWALTLTSS